MKIKEGFLKFSELCQGDCFNSHGDLYIKTQEAQKGIEIINAVHLETGDLYYFYDDYNVFPRFNAEITE